MVAQLAREESDQAAATFFGHVTDWDFLRFLLLPCCCKREVGYSSHSSHTIYIC